MYMEHSACTHLDHHSIASLSGRMQRCLSGERAAVDCLLEGQGDVASHAPPVCFLLLLPQEALSCLNRLGPAQVPDLQSRFSCTKRGVYYSRI